LGVGLINLVTQATSIWPTAPEFVATELIGGADDGSQVYAVVGVTTPTSEGKRVDYAIGKLDVSAHTMQIVAGLSTPFF
jgi:hypothetical protein